MAQPTGVPEFAALAWHDNVLYGLRLEVGDPARGDWHSDLVLDIDRIVEWLCGTDRQVRFRVAPATLTFHAVTDLRIAIDCGDGRGQVALHALAIDVITRERIEDQKICLGRPYWRFRMALNWPRGGAIAFGASGFTQALRAEPLVLDQQQLRPVERLQKPGRIRSPAMREALAIHDAYRRGDLEALSRLLGEPPNFLNCRGGPAGVGEIILEYAIYHSPRAFIRTLLELGADPNYRDHAGFRSLIAALSTDRPDRYQIIELLLGFGADIQARGINDWPRLHYAAATDDLDGIRLLLGRGADPGRPHPGSTTTRRRSRKRRISAVPPRSGCCASSPRAEPASTTAADPIIRPALWSPRLDR